MAISNFSYYFWLLKRSLRRFRSSGNSSNFKRWFIGLSVAFIVIFPPYVFYLDYVVRSQFEGKRWALPARVYARPLELFVGKVINANQFIREIKELNYQKVNTPTQPGSYSRSDSNSDTTIHIVTRAFTFWDGKESWVPVVLEFNDDRIMSLKHAGSGDDIGLVRLDPALIASIYPAHNEDRILLKMRDVPPLLIKTLLAVEDRNFYQHWGIRPQSIARALLVNLRAGGTVQGGSTLTQQLVKNFYLSQDRTLWRKFNEAIMASLLEFHYEKDEILEAYLNEIYLGQSGKRAIHGFGLASQFYFQQPLHKLQLDQIALLVALVKGASYYDPRRHPARAKKRRNLILDLLIEQDILDNQQNNNSLSDLANKAKNKKLGVTKRATSRVSEFPAFIDLVRRQLRRDYQDKDLTSEGLQIFTTLDPLIQRDTEKALSSRIKRFERNRRLSEGELQGASIVVSVDGAEVLAVVGGRDPRFAGFNRALNAVRQIGSLIKPVVYLTALDRPDYYTLITPIPDEPIKLKSGKDKDEYWQPKNFDHKIHGLTPLHTALSKSYNLSTAYLGMAVGLSDVLRLLRQLGIEREFKAYPSLLLGAVALSPLEVTQMYHTLANGGFRSELRAIRAVLTVEGKPLQRYPLSIEQTVSDDSVYLLNTLLQEAVRDGTGHSLYDMLPASLAVAGKTGTTDELRDSWFAGFTSDRLAVVWLGLDDNKPAGLTGSSGALRVWGDIIKAIGAQATRFPKPDNIEYVWVNPLSISNRRVSQYCEGAVQFPFIVGSAPIEESSCNEGVPVVEKD